MELVPIPAAPLQTRHRKRDDPLVLEQRDQSPVVRILLGRQAAGEARAEIHTAGGYWRVEADPDRSGRLRAVGEDGAVAAHLGRQGAVRKRRAIELPHGETLEFVRRNLLLTTFNLGSGLIRGRAGWLAPGRGRFSVTPSQEAVQRPDGELLVGLFTLLTRWGIQQEARLSSLGGPSGP